MCFLINKTSIISPTFTSILIWVGYLLIKLLTGRCDIKTLVAPLINVALACLLRQIVLSNNVTLDRASDHLDRLDQDRLGYLILLRLLNA